MSKLGDYLDHYSDLLAIIIYTYFMYPLSYTEIIIILLFGIMMSIHLGKQQQLYRKNKKDNELLDVLIINSLDFIPISITRYFGCGTCILFLVVLFITRHIYNA